VVQQLGHEADHSLQASANIKKEQRYAFMALTGKTLPFYQRVAANTYT